MNDKIKAVIIHFMVSIIIVSAFLMFVYWVWYDQIYVDVFGVTSPMKLLFIVDVILGPFLTFIIYKKGKPGLKLDLGIIILVQLLAFVYGAYSLYVGKPTLVVKRLHSFDVVIQKDIDMSLLTDDVKKTLGFFAGPQYGMIPDDRLNIVQLANQQQGEIIPLKFSDQSTIESAIQGEDIETYSMIPLDVILQNMADNNYTLDGKKLYILNFTGDFWVMVVDENHKLIHLVANQPEM